MKTAIWWVRRDLRLDDNPALEAAMAGANQVVPVFIQDPALLSSPYVGDKRLSFLNQGLGALHEDLLARGSGLLIRKGRPAAVLKELASELEAGRVFAQEDFSPYARSRDGRVGEVVDLALTPGVVVHHPRKVLKDDGDPYTVFTPFSKKWRQVPLSEAPSPAAAHIPTPAGVRWGPRPTPILFDPPLPFKAGEAEARERLYAFTRGEKPLIFRYAEDRNRVDLEGTSGLSPYFRFGMLSARQAAVEALRASREAPDEASRKGAETWLNEVIWREFFQGILYHFPRVRQASFREDYQSIQWANDEEEFEAWCQGRTGYPLVDAAMRQLLALGWMHNRARMVVASFLTKDLLIDWRWGEGWFMQHLVDGDPGSNNGGWQWTAGTGTDAAPYFRIFNPISQSKKHDPEGAYIRRWVPELAVVPDSHIHEPWDMPEDLQRETGCLIGRDYPAPIVDHQWARERTLVAYKQARS